MLKGVVIPQTGEQALDQQDEADIADEKDEGHDIRGQDISGYSEEGSPRTSDLLGTQRIDVDSNDLEEVLIDFGVERTQKAVDMLRDFEVEEDVGAGKDEVVDEA